MSKEIEVRVKVNSYGPGRPLGLVYVDPISGRKKAKSAATTDWRTAERLAGELEKELQSGRYAPPSKLSWADFRKRYEAEKLPALSDAYRGAFKTAANHLERILDPGKLTALTPQALSRFQSLLRAEGRPETSIANILRHLHAAFVWGAKLGYLVACPAMEISRVSGAKARPITAEELDRMVEAVPRVRPTDAAEWVFLLKAVFHSGLRLSEAFRLSWEADALFSVDLTGGNYPAFAIQVKGQKGRRAERMPMTREFFDLLTEARPDEEDRAGLVFRLNGQKTRVRMAVKRASRVVSAIGRAARVVTATVEKRKMIDGKPVTVTVKKAASIHDVRRGFLETWSRKVPSQILMRLGRHRNIATTLTYYATGDCDQISRQLWRSESAGDSGNRSGNNGRVEPQNAEGAPDAATSETPCGNTTYASGGQGSRTLNRLPGT